MTEEQKKEFIENAKGIKVPVELDILLSDIQVLGKREVGELLKWRSKLRIMLAKRRRENK